MEPQAYLQSTVDEVGSVFATRCRPEALPDLSDSLESREKPGQEGLQRYSAGNDHRPNGFREVVRSPAELVCIVEGVGEELRCGSDGGPAGPEGFMVADCAGNAVTFVLPERKRQEDLFRLLRPPFGMVLLRSPDIVEKAGQVGEEDPPPDARVTLPLLDEDQGADIGGHLLNVGESMTETVAPIFDDPER